MWLFVWDSEPSKIFVWDTQISKVFLWDTQVRPSAKVYEFDFTDSTWWALTNASLSNGKLLGTSANFLWSYNMWSLVGAKKITIDANLYGVVWSWAGTMWQSFKVNIGSTQYSIWSIVNYMNNNWYKSSWIKFMQTGSYGSDTLINTNTKYWSGIVMPVHSEYDIENKTATFSMNNTLIGTATINDTLINLFNNQTSTGNFELSWSKSWWYYTYLKVVIE